MLQVVAPTRLTDRVLLEFPAEDHDLIVIDATEMAWIEPAGLVQLALLARSAVQRAVEVFFLAPANDDCGSYLDRMDFFATMPQSVELTTNSSYVGRTRRYRNEVLLELKHFRTDAEVESLAERLLPFLQDWYARSELSQASYDAFKEAIPELCGNAASHSGSPYGSFLAAQTYAGNRRLLAVGDLGIGIRHHLANNPRYAHLASDEAAIIEALKPDVTGTADRRGWGFEEVLTKLVAAGSGSLLVCSGSGWVRVTVRHGRRSRASGTATKHFPGTLVQLAIE